MFRLAYRQLLLDPTRALLTGFALAVVFAVILVLQGFEQGQYAQLRRAVWDRGADLIVAQAGVSNLIGPRSALPQLSRGQVEAVEGVANAHPITGLPVMYEQRGKKTPVFMLVYDTLGGPARIWRGRSVQGAREIVVDISLARKYGLSPGDSLEISDFAFTIAGLTKNTSALFMPFVFVNYDGLIDFYLESEVVADFSAFPLLSFLLVELVPGANPEMVAQRIEAQVGAVDVYTPGRLAANDENLGRDMLAPIMGLLVTVAYVIGLLVVGLIMYADVSARTRSFGVLKALGFEQSALRRTVLIQTTLLSSVAYPVGLVLAVAIAAFIHWSAPLYPVLVTELGPLVQTLIAGFVFALLGALAPVRLIARVDPMIVFQGS